MTDRYENIRKALAMGPTPGPWELKDGRTDTIENAQGYPVCTVHHHPYELYSHGVRAAYIAACDPDTIRELLDERDALAKDAARLDFLDRLNTTLNSTYGTKYRWKLILSHNVIRLMSGRGGNGLVADIDLHDSSPSANGCPSCRGAIDAAMEGEK